MKISEEKVRRFCANLLMICSVLGIIYIFTEPRITVTMIPKLVALIVMFLMSFVIIKEDITK